jgi:hypothetical protein
MGYLLYKFGNNFYIIIGYVDADKVLQLRELLGQLSNFIVISLQLS